MWVVIDKEVRKMRMKILEMNVRVICRPYKFRYLFRLGSNNFGGSDYIAREVIGLWLYKWLIGIEREGKV